MSFPSRHLNLTGSVSCDSLGQAPIIPFNSSSLFFACAFLGGRRLKNVLDLKLLESPCQHSVPIHLKLVPDFAPPSGVCSGLVPYFARKYFILGFKSFLQCITFVTNKTWIARQHFVGTWSQLWQLAVWTHGTFRNLKPQQFTGQLLWLPGFRFLDVPSISLLKMFPFCPSGRAPNRWFWTKTS